MEKRWAKKELSFFTLSRSINERISIFLLISAHLTLCSQKKRSSLDAYIKTISFTHGEINWGNQLGSVFFSFIFLLKAYVFCLDFYNFERNQQTRQLINLTKYIHVTVLRYFFAFLLPHSNFVEILHSKTANA